MLPAKVLLLFCQYNGVQAYIMSALLWSCISNWSIQLLIIQVALVVCHQNQIGASDLTSIIQNHSLESLSILASLPIFLQCIMLAHQSHQAAFKIHRSISIEVINNNQKPYWLNELEYLWHQQSGECILCILKST